MEELQVGDRVTWVMGEDSGVGEVVSISDEFFPFPIKVTFKGGDKVVYGNAVSFMRVE